MEISQRGKIMVHDGSLRDLCSIDLLTSHELVSAYGNKASLHLILKYR